jgi:hypothetical protein
VSPDRRGLWEWRVSLAVGVVALIVGAVLLVRTVQSDEVRVLTSAHVWFDPAPYVADREALDVYIDPERAERYFVDLSFLPRQG